MNNFPNHIKEVIDLVFELANRSHPYIAEFPTPATTVFHVYYPVFRSINNVRTAMLIPIQNVQLVGTSIAITNEIFHIATEFVQYENFAVQLRSRIDDVLNSLVETNEQFPK